MMNVKTLIVVFGLATATALIGCKSAGGPDAQSVPSYSSSSAKPYPLKTCIVTDEALGGHGDIVTFAYQGQEVKLCCQGCREDFDKEPANYLAKLKPGK